MFAVAYYRRSTTLQQHSISMQRDRAQRKAFEKGLILEDEYIDDAVSARKIDYGDRKELSRLLDYLHRHPDRVLLVYKRDRLSRKALDYIAIYKQLRKLNITVLFTSSQELEMRYDPMGEFFENILAIMNQRDGDQIVERLKATFDANFRSGAKPGTLPYGYQINKSDGSIDLNETALSDVKTMYRMLVEEGKPLSKIASHLTSIKGEQWPPNKITQLLRNPTYMGLRIRKTADKIIEQPYLHLAIVDQDTWLSAQRILDGQSTTRKRRKIFDLSFPLQELLVCKTCSKSLNSKGYSYDDFTDAFYFCPDCKAKVPKGDLEKLVLEHGVAYFNSLLDSNFEDMLKVYRNKTIASLTKHRDQASQEIKKKERRLFKKVDQWFETSLVASTERSEVESKLIGLYKERENLSTLSDKISERLFELDQLPHKLKEIRLSINHLKDSSEHELRKLFRDILLKVSIEGSFVDIQFKHPFCGPKEVLPIE